MSLIDVIPKDYFSGQKNIAEDPDSKRELADLIIELEEAVNASGGSGVSRQEGTGTVTSPALFVDVVFPTAMTGLTPIVVCTPIDQSTAMHVSAVGPTGFRAHIAGSPGVDMDFYWMAFGS